MEEEADLSLYLAAGPALLLAALSLGGRGAPDLILLSLFGLALCFQWRLRGLAYALILLSLTALVRHAFFLDRHLAPLALELSMALSFAVTAAACQMQLAKEEVVRQKAERSTQAMKNLEEDFFKERQEAQQERIALQDKSAALQKQLDESQSDCKALEILNEVIRKSAIKCDAPQEQLRERDVRINVLLAEIESLTEERARLKDQSQLQSQCEELHRSLNAARVQKEQTHLINETLARLLASHTKRMQELEEEVQRWQEMAREASLSKKQLEEELALSVQENRAALLSQLEEQKQRFAVVEERLAKATEQQAAHLQLKAQFEEKNTILHETRVELFRADTALQAYERQQELEKANPSPERPLDQLLAEQERHLTALEQERDELMALVTVLSQPPLDEREVLKNLVKRSQARKATAPLAKAKKTVKKK